MNNKKIVTILAIIIALVVTGLFFGAFNRDQATALPGSTTPSGDAVVAVISDDIVLTITPSTQEDNWLMYRTGAIALVKSQSPVSQVVIKAMPTGTGAGEMYPNGMIIAQAVKLQGTDTAETWQASLPNDILATNMWAEAIDAQGNVIRTADLGNVGFQE